MTHEERRIRREQKKADKLAIKAQRKQEKIEESYWRKMCVKLRQKGALLEDDTTNTQLYF